MTGSFFQTDRLSPPIEQWPEGDRIAFLKAAGTGRGPFQRPRSVRSPYTLQKVMRSYARYLRYLDYSGGLQPLEPVYDRVSPDRLDGYLKHLRERGNADKTILGRFEELQTALRLMYSKRDFRWITKPHGVPLKRILPMQTKAIVTIDSAVLLAWAEEMFDEGIGARTSAARCHAVRNAVILGLLAERAPRLRALSLLRLGDSLKRGEASWLLREHSEMMKMRAAHYVPVSSRVTRMLDRYVEVERIQLLGSECETAAVWVKPGGALAASAIQSIVATAFKRRFGARQGPHFFRHCLGTTLADQLPDYPLDAPTMLAHGAATTTRFYNHTKKVSCAGRLEVLLESLRPGFIPTRTSSSA